LLLNADPQIVNSIILENELNEFYLYLIEIMELQHKQVAINIVEAYTIVNWLLPSLDNNIFELLIERNMLDNLLLKVSQKSTSNVYIFYQFLKTVAEKMLTTDYIFFNLLTIEKLYCIFLSARNIECRCEILRAVYFGLITCPIEYIDCLYEFYTLIFSENFVIEFRPRFYSISASFYRSKIITNIVLNCSIFTGRILNDFSDINLSENLIILILNSLILLIQKTNCNEINFNDSFIENFLRHQNEEIQFWTIQLILSIYQNKYLAQSMSFINSLMTKSLFDTILRHCLKKI
jgi:hypothetical protein